MIKMYNVHVVALTETVHYSIYVRVAKDLSAEVGLIVDDKPHFLVYAKPEELTVVMALLYDDSPDDIVESVRELYRRIENLRDAAQVLDVLRQQLKWDGEWEARQTDEGWEIVLNPREHADSYFPR